MAPVIQVHAACLLSNDFIQTSILTDEHLAIETAFIDLNAHMAGIKFGYYDIYPWTAFPLHAGLQSKSKIPEQLWTPSFWFLRLGPDSNSRHVAYSELTNTGPGAMLFT